MIDLEQNNSPIARIIAASNKLSCAVNRYLCTKAREWMAAGGDPAGAYMEHLAQLAEENQEGGNDRGT